MAGPEAGINIDQHLPRYPSSPAAMSSETNAELADLVHEWLRIDQVRVDNVLTWWFDTKSRNVKNPGTKREISDLWAAGYTEELNKRLRYNPHPPYLWITL